MDLNKILLEDINISNTMTPQDFKKLTGHDWTEILYIIKNYKNLLNKENNKIVNAATVKTSINTELTDDDIYDVCLQLDEINCLTGHIFECLCFIYFAMQNKNVKLQKDKFNNPEYDIIFGNSIIQCKWHNGENLVNFGTYNKSYNRYSNNFYFSVIIGSQTETKYYFKTDKNYIQLAANYAKLMNETRNFNPLEDLKKYGLTKISGNYNGKKFNPFIYKNSINEDINQKEVYLSYLTNNINGEVDISKLKDYIKVKGTNLFVNNLFLEDISSKVENISFKNCVDKFIGYFNNDNLRRIANQKTTEQKEALNNSSLKFEKQKIKNSINKANKIKSRIGNNYVKNTVINTTKQMFNY